MKESRFCLCKFYLSASTTTSSSATVAAAKTASRMSTAKATSMAASKTTDMATAESIHVTTAIEVREAPGMVHAETAVIESRGKMVAAKTTRAERLNVIKAVVESVIETMIKMVEAVEAKV